MAILETPSRETAKNKLINLWGVPRKDKEMIGEIDKILKKMEDDINSKTNDRINKLEIEVENFRTIKRLLK